MSTPTLKRKIDMSKQSCNYCKLLGHRIHAMDAFGVYLVGTDGERVRACPVLVERAKRDTRAKEEFPALPGQKGVAASAATLALPGAIAAAEKDRKQREWFAAKELKEQKKREWTERHVKRMEQKYGDNWHQEVKGKEGEDCDYADRLREKDEEKERIWEDAFEQEEESAFMEREARRAPSKEDDLTDDDESDDEEDGEDEEEMDCAFEAAKLEHEYYSTRAGNLLRR